MVARDLFGRFGNKVPGAWQRSGTSTDHGPKTPDAAPDAAPLGGTRAQAVQRLQIGITGVFAMILLVGLADAIGGQASKAELDAVPDAAPTTEPTDAPAQRDPLADAGVVPDITNETDPTNADQPNGAQTIGGQGNAGGRANQPRSQRRLTVPDTPPTRPRTDRDDD